MQLWRNERKRGMTNYEKIKNMTIEEMAECLQDGINECDCCAYGLNFACPNTCIYGIKKWLETEVQENENPNKQKAR